MYLLNITFLVANQTLAPWNTWVRTSFIASVVANGDFHSPQLARVHAPENEQDGLSFALQFRTDSKSTIDNWLETEGARLQQTCMSNFGGSVLFFATTLELLP